MKDVNLQLIMNGTKKHKHYTFVLNTKMEIPSMCVRNGKIFIRVKGKEIRIKYNQVLLKKDEMMKACIVAAIILYIVNT